MESVVKVESLKLHYCLFYVCVFFSFSLVCFLFFLVCFYCFLLFFIVFCFCFVFPFFVLFACLLFGFICMGKFSRSSCANDKLGVPSRITFIFNIRASFFFHTNCFFCCILFHFLSVRQKTFHPAKELFPNHYLARLAILKSSSPRLSSNPLSVNC